MDPVVVVVVLVVIALIAFVVAAQRMGKRTMVGTSDADPALIIDAARRAFAGRWEPTGGPGVINMRRKALREKGRSVVSVGIERRAQGDHMVSVWMSHGAAWVEMGDALVIKGIQEKVLAAVQALPSVSVPLQQASASFPQPTAQAPLRSEAQGLSLPAPRVATSREQAGALLEEVGQIQREVVGGAPLDGVGEELVSRIEGAALYYLRAHADPVVVFDQIIAPITEWGMGRLMGPWMMDQTSRQGVAGKHAFDVVCALREKYQHLNPANN